MYYNNRNHELLRRRNMKKYFYYKLIFTYTLYVSLVIQTPNIYLFTFVLTAKMFKRNSLSRL
jgi:hypothetical protein